MNSNGNKPTRSPQQSGELFSSSSEDLPDTMVPAAPPMPALPSTRREAANCERVVLVVGDKFAAFSDGACIVTKADLLSRLARGTTPVSQIVVGQGIGPASLREVQGAVARYAFDFRGGRPVSLREHVSQRLAAHEVHKRRPENVLITRPLPTGELNTFASHLVVDDDADDIADHVTGLHVPGMCVIEAARQACLAMNIHVPQASGFDDRQSTYTLNSISAAYSKFLYPSEVQIEINAPSWPAARAGEVYQGRLEITFTQYQLVAAKVVIESTRHLSALLARMEHLGARQHHNRLLRSASACVPLAQA
jgi:hypothetical protein